MFNPLSKMNVSTLGLDVDLLEAAKKCNCKENDAYNPTGGGPANLPSEPSGSKADAMPSTPLNIAYEAKKKMKKEGVFGDHEPGGPKTYHKDNPV
jgi:hypothetical protein